MYIDPNTGGMLFQTLAILFGVFSGLILFFSSRIKMWAAHFMRLVRRNREKPGTSGTNETTAG